MTVLKGITPTPAQLASAYREVFDSVIAEAGGRDGRITAASAERIGDRSDAGKLVADNLLNFLEKTGQKSVGVAKFQSVIADYVEREAKKAAGPNQRLSLLEIRNLPTDLIDDAMHLRGRDQLASPLPRLAFNENDMYAYLTTRTTTPEAVVNTGTVTHDGNAVVIRGLNDVGAWQSIAEATIATMWDRSFQHRALGSTPVDIGGNRGMGELQLDKVVDAATGKEGVLAYWKDIDDDSFAWFFEKKNYGTFAELHSVYLN